MQHPSKIRVAQPFIIFMVFAIAAIYFINALNTGNWLWFQSNATHVRPSRIVIMDHGQEIVISPGHANFNMLADAIEQSLSELNNTEAVGIGLSEETLNDYDTDGLVLELYFDTPVQFNSIARLGNPTQLLIPLEGRHSEGGLVFRGDRGEWWYGAVRMANPLPLYAALQQIGYTVSANQPAG